MSAADATPLRVVTVIPQSDTASGFVFARRQTDSLRELGAVVETFFLSNRQSLRGLLAERRRFRALLRRVKPDLVHTHYGTMTAFFSVTATRLPVVITFHGSDLNPCPSIPMWRSVSGRLLSQLAALRAARIVCVSDALRSRLWWRRSIVTVIPMGVDLTGFSPSAQPDARSALGWPEGDRVVLFNAGSGARLKRLDLAEQSVAVASSLVGPTRLVVTDGTVSPDMMPTLFNAADCLLVTSDYEGSPTVVKEAMACDLPVVSVDVGDVRERLEGVTPSRIVPRDPTLLGRAVADVLAMRRRSNGRLAVQGFDSVSIARRVLAQFQAARGC